MKLYLSISNWCLLQSSFVFLWNTFLQVWMLLWTWFSGNRNECIGGLGEGKQMWISQLMFWWLIFTVFYLIKAICSQRAMSIPGEYRICIYCSQNILGSSQDSLQFKLMITYAWSCNWVLGSRQMVWYNGNKAYFCGVFCLLFLLPTFSSCS